MKTALLVGATGLVGKQCLYKLLENPDFTHVIIIVRKKLTISHSKLIQLTIDFDDLNTLDLPMPVTHVFCCLGTTMKKAGSKEAFYKVDYTYIVESAKLGLKFGASHFLLVSALGADSQSPIYYSRVKGEVEHSIAQIGYPSVTIFRPSILLGDRDEFRLVEKIGVFFAEFLRFLFVGPLAKYKGIHAATVAKAMLQASNTPQIGVNVVENEAMVE